MSYKYLALAMGAAAASFPQITIHEDGKPKTLYIVNGGEEAKGGDRVEVQHNHGYYLATSPQTGPDNFYGVNLLGGSIEYDVDLSQSGCSCNAAFYLVLMPAKDENGKPSGGEWGNYYCDANYVNQQWCPEFDIMEANKFAFYTTPHKCDDPNENGHYTNCDRGGQCVQKAWHKMAGKYGPGENFAINTLKEFHAKISFQTDAHFKVELSQDGQTFSMESDESCSDYLSKITDNLASKMALAISNWGEKYETMSWLDGETGCSGECDNNPIYTVKNIKYTSGARPHPSPPPPGPDPKPEYEFGNECKTSTDDDCKLVTCPEHSCKYSWPKKDPAKWKSKDAKCRCETAEEEEEDEENLFVLQNLFIQ